MRNKRAISWTTAMRTSRRERARPAGVREEPLRATAGLRGSFNLSSWRGRSGRRYVVGIHGFADAEALEIADAVLIAVRRDHEGVANVVGATAAQSADRTRWSWMLRMREGGATEVHVHRLAEGEDERLAIVADLVEEDPAGLTSLVRGALTPDQ